MLWKEEFVSQPVVGVLSAEDIGQVIRHRRRELGYTQKHFSSLMGISPRLLGEIERGNGRIGIQKVLNLVLALDIECIFAMRDRW
ncbi:MAG: helix-turn-helix domain-containing protein [Actinomycetia bacterium]|nr:helix-turn-helix domain-containing protein [Actinomycetes bacterium]